MENNYKQFVRSKVGENQGERSFMLNRTENNSKANKILGSYDKIRFTVNHKRPKNLSVPNSPLDDKTSESKENEYLTSDDDSTNRKPVGEKFNRNHMMESAILNTFAGLIRTLKQSNYVAEGWDQISKRNKIFRIFCCFKKRNELELDKEQELFKFFRLANTVFSDKNEFHKSILFTYYNLLTQKTTFKYSKNTWKTLGFSSEDYQQNELSFPNCLISIFFLIFLFEKKLGIYANFKVASQNINSSPIKISLLLFNEAIMMLRTQSLNSIIENHKSPIKAFFKFIVGVIKMWLAYIESEKFDRLREDSTDQEERLLKIERSLAKILKRAHKTAQECIESYHSD